MRTASENFASRATDEPGHWSHQRVHAGIVRTHAGNVRASSCSSQTVRSRVRSSSLSLSCLVSHSQIRRAKGDVGSERICGQSYLHLPLRCSLPTWTATRDLVRDVSNPTIFREQHVRIVSLAHEMASCEHQAPEDRNEEREPRRLSHSSESGCTVHSHRKFLVIARRVAHTRYIRNRYPTAAPTRSWE